MKWIIYMRVDCVSFASIEQEKKWRNFSEHKKIIKSKSYFDEIVEPHIWHFSSLRVWHKSTDARTLQHPPERTPNVPNKNELNVIFPFLVLSPNVFFFFICVSIFEMNLVMEPFHVSKKSKLLIEYNFKINTKFEMKTKSFSLKSDHLFDGFARRAKKKVFSFSWTIIDTSLLR